MIYHVIVKNTRTGAITSMTASPVSHTEACTILRKFTTKRPWLLKQLLEIDILHPT